ncbi:hypothetical protein BDZ97DRAFT_1652777 [Flammula alnicola]|nr:hypothetical protein BDZ97DRAFT_1652777 [Flammula alnicola]
MSRKRSIEEEDRGESSQYSSSPRKRTRRDSASFPQTPAGCGSSGSPWRATLATPRTPYTPYPLHASDSPSNPFGRKRQERLFHSLPPVSSFSKHITLRFQFVRRGVSPRQGGVHRVVRVPMNYTFTHLRSVIAWLFNTPARYSNGKAGEEEYLFEVKSKTAMYSPLYKPGQIKSGTTMVKLSNVHDPGRWRSGYRFGVEEDELSEDEEEEMGDKESQVGTEDGIEEESDEWKWVDEEDYTLAHAWPRGLDPQTGIIYYHSPTTQIHITVNRTMLPRQRGISNTPSVFSARGRVHLSPPPLPRPMFSTSILHTLSSSPVVPVDSRWKGKSVARLKSPSPPRRSQGKDKLVSRQPLLGELDQDTDADGDTDQDLQSFNSNHPFFQSQRASPRKQVRHEEAIVLVEDSDVEEDEDDTRENHDAQIDPKKWNEPAHAFALYFLQFMDPLGLSYDDIDELFFEEPNPLRLNLSSTPGLTHCDSSSSSLPPSSPGNHLSSPSLKFSFANSSSISLPDPADLSVIVSEHYPNKKYSQTPAPPKKRKHRLRIRRLEKRLEKIKKAEFLCKYDEVVEEPVVEVDELADDGEVEPVGWTKPVLKEGEVWDPFGDEPEV